MPKLNPNPRPYVYPRRRADGTEVWSANVRRAKQAKVFVGTLETREEAMEACAVFIATGQRPPGRKRGRKPGQRNPKPRQRPTAAQKRQQAAGRPRALPPACPRVEMMRQIARRLAA